MRCTFKDVSGSLLHPTPYSRRDQTAAFFEPFVLLVGEGGGEY
jgi:hypothetical protein